MNKKKPTGIVEQMREAKTKKEKRKIVKTMRVYNETISPYRQSEKQRQSSMIAESKWGKRCTLAMTNTKVQLKKSSFAEHSRPENLKTSRTKNS